MVYEQTAFVVGRSKLLKWSVWLFACCILVYLLLGAYVYKIQRSIIYFPSGCSSQQVSEGLEKAKLQRWTNASGQFIGLKRLSPQQPARGSVLITYGNGSSALGCAHYATDIQKAAAFDVFILEYPGYQDRVGKPTQRSFFDAADDAFRSLPPNKPIYLVGESLGSGVACHLAGSNPDLVGGIVLISPYNKLAAVAQMHMVVFPVKLLLLDEFASEDYLRNFHGRVGIIVDGKDTVVPEKFGRRLYDGYAGPKKLWEFPQGGHIQIPHPDVFWKEVVNFWQANGQP